LIINILNSDCNIWNKDYVVAEITNQMLSSTDHIYIHTNSEGPCARSLGLYSLLDWLTDRFNYPKTKISISTCNLLEQHKEYQIKILPQTVYLESAKNHAGIAILNSFKTFNDKFKLFGNFIGHSNLPRLKLSSHLYTDKDTSLQTYHTKITSDYHRPFIAIEDLMCSGESWETIKKAINLIKNSPIILDEIQTYPILNPVTFNIYNMYPNFFIEIVNVTYFTGNTFYLDEKIWRPILMKTPFIVQGPQWFLKNLKHLGFITFDNFWDEGYSEDPANIQADAIIKNIEYLKTKSITELQNMYNSMQDILDHNYNVMMNLDKNTILEKFVQ
jgi:hypothetical protein